jgi:hypothetical protein
MPSNDEEPFHPVPFSPPPLPPEVAYSYVGFAAFGILHLVLAALFPECLQKLNLVLGLVEILIAIWIFVAVSRWRKEHDAWQRSGDKTPPTTAR